MRWELEFLWRDVLSERDDIDSLAVLGHAEVLRVENLVERHVAVFLERAEDGLEGAPLVMHRQALHVLAEDDLGLVGPVGADAQRVEEQGSARSAFVVVVEALALPCQAERLTGEACEAYVEVWHLGGVDLRDVARDFEGVVEVGAVRLAGGLVELAREDGLYVLAERLVEAHADAADSSEQVYRLVFRVGH